MVVTSVCLLATAACVIFSLSGLPLPHHAPCRIAETRIPLTVMAPASTIGFYFVDAAGLPPSARGSPERRNRLTTGGSSISASSFTLHEVSRPCFLSSVTLSRLRESPGAGQRCCRAGRRSFGVCEDLLLVLRRSDFPSSTAIFDLPCGILFAGPARTMTFEPRMRRNNLEDPRLSTANDDPNPNGAETSDHALLEKINSILKGQASPVAAHVRKLRT